MRFIINVDSDSSWRFMVEVEAENGIDALQTAANLIRGEPLVAVVEPPTKRKRRTSAARRKKQAERTRLWRERKRAQMAETAKE
jgi:hypothetical protein